MATALADARPRSSGLSPEERHELEQAIRVFRRILEADPTDVAAREAVREASARLAQAEVRESPLEVVVPAPARTPAPAPLRPGPLVDNARRQFPRLGELMVAEGLLSADELPAILLQHKASGEKLGALLVKLGRITEDQLVTFLSRQYAVRSVALAGLTFDPELLQLVPPAIAKKHDVMPIARAGRTLTLAMADTSDVAALDDVAFVTNLHLDPVLASLSAIRLSIERHYGAPPTVASMLSELVDEDVELLDDRDAITTADVFELKESADQAPVVKLVNSILVDAIERGASDVHWEPYEDQLRVRLRVDGILQERWSPPKRLASAIVSRLKIMANMDIAERRVPQDGRIRLRHRQREVDLRVSMVPASFGEKCVVRILDKDAVRLDLTTLGFDAAGFDKVKAAITQPYGMVLITGPTGSGKTTTLYAAIHTINSPTVNILTAEDPIEYNLMGINQVQVSDGVGRTFAVALRSFLRQDPDVILVGETRDLETAQIAVRAALTGHLVFSTLHTNDCASTVTRLVDMGVPAYLVSSSLLLVVAQRLVRRLCEACREPYEVDDEALTVYGHAPSGPSRRTLYRRVGCDACGHTGMKGRVAVYETMPITPDLRATISSGRSVEDIRALARAEGMKTLREAALARVLDGTTTVEELLRVTLA